MGVKISELVEKTTANSSDVIPVVDTGTKKMKLSTLLSLVFPIGSTYITQTNTNPSTILGFGTWERLKGKVCLGLDEDDSNLNAVGKKGGEKTHTLTLNEIPVNQITTTNVSSAATDGYIMRGGYTKAVDYNMGGQNQSHNNMQPYEVVGYMWIRKS